MPPPVRYHDLEISIDGQVLPNVSSLEFQRRDREEAIYGMDGPIGRTRGTALVTDRDATCLGCGARVNPDRMVHVDDDTWYDGCVCFRMSSGGYEVAPFNVTARFQAAPVVNPTKVLTAWQRLLDDSEAE